MFMLFFPCPFGHIIYVSVIFFLCPFGHIIYISAIFPLSIWTYYLCFPLFFFVHLDILFMFPLFSLCPFGHINYVSTIFLCPFGHIIYVSAIFSLSIWTYYLCFRYFFFVHLDALFMFPSSSFCPLGPYFYL